MRRLNDIALAQGQPYRHPHWNRRDILIDRRLLEKHIELATKRLVDYVSPLGWTDPGYERWYRSQLLLLVESALPSGRRVLLVCPVCASLACGFISANIEIRGDWATWSELGTETEWSPDFEALGFLSFVFDLDAYRAALDGYGAA